ncbi:MAG: N-6 DNA methylase [Saprospiraceae bacterium]|nr:N-6 DNA methylase [Saprospiraceae bacterium]
MAKTKNQEAAYDIIASRVEQFSDQREIYKKKYNETQTRIDFINPFFMALGWDIDNTKLKLPEAYRDVIHEDKIKVGGKTKAPDYCFTNYGKKQFFLEAKKPSVSVKTDVEPSYQLRRYGWSAKLPISILTDFEEFAVYDCSRTPKPEESAATGRLKYITFDNYLKEFDWIWDLFAKEQVIKGSLDQFASSDKKGTQTVDSVFLQSLDEWRSYLATSIALRNKQLDEDEINYIVQMNLNRIVFLRNCEDRGIEPYGKLKESLINAKDEGGYFRHMVGMFYEADRKYNSGLFDFAKDTYSKTVVVDNKVIKTITEELYYPKSPYEFSVIGAEILGTAYERFLGKVIRLTTAHHAKVEEKPEVRKAGGVFYTPQYIVEHIVKQTVGKLIEGKTPEEIAKIKICDPACGSGSFLLGAFQFLLDYHLNWYTKKYTKSKAAKGSPLTPEGNLTTQVKKQILLNNIFGVDIDTQAVEVTKLSLLMKCMEGETNASMQTTLAFERILPTLDNNIKSGNSLIDMDFYEGKLDFGEDKKIKPFNWKSKFPEVFKQGGFDVLIGNPPWGADFDDECLNYLRKKYKEIIVRMIDSFMYFTYKSYSLMKDKGYFGMIVPDVLFYQVDNTKLREFLVKNTIITDLINMGDVFEQVVRPSCIITFKKSKPNGNNKIKIGDFSANKKHQKNTALGDNSLYSEFTQSKIHQIPNYLFHTKNTDNYLIIEKINKLKIKKLSEFVDDDGIQRGVSPDLKEAFLVNSTQVKDNDLEKSHLKNALTGGKQVKRYNIDYPDLQLIYTKRNEDYKKIPKICKYIDKFKDKITCREVKENKHSMYALHRAREERIFTKKDKLVGVITEDEIVVAIDNKMTFVTDGLYLFGVKGIDIKFLMAILNSKLFVFVYRLLSMESGRVLAQVKPTLLNELPIIIVDEKNKFTKMKHDEIISNVDLILKANTELAKADENKKLVIKDRISYSIQRIDELVYELYDLTKEEIEIVENQ